MFLILKFQVLKILINHFTQKNKNFLPLAKIFRDSLLFKILIKSNFLKFLMKKIYFKFLFTVKK